MSGLPDPSRWATTLTRLAVAAVVVFLAACVLWRAQGGEWNRVESPSMGTRAPVGSLLWVTPVDVDRLEVGDLVTFRPPGSTVTYSHLVHDRRADGTLGTRGVISGIDPWRLTQDDVVGRVAVTWPGVGWLVAAAPVLLVGGLLVAASRAVVRIPWRAPATLVLGSLVVSIAITVHQPFLGAQELGFVTLGSGGADATYVGTGLLPVRLESPDGDQVVLHAGEVGSVHVSADDAADDGRLEVALGPAVPPWWWASLVLACFVPALVSSAGDLRTRRGSRGRGSAAGCRRRPRAACP